MAYHDTYKMPVTITRCSNNYGPYHFPEKLIPLIIKNILEGKKLPVPHCIRDTDGWQIRSELDALRKTEPIDKETFGSTDLAGELVAMNEDNEIESITFVGLCTDICVISNALLVKASLPEVSIIVDAKCCAGVTPESHENALKAMEACQIQIDR